EGEGPQGCAYFIRSTEWSRLTVRQCTRVTLPESHAEADAFPLAVSALLSLRLSGADLSDRMAADVVFDLRRQHRIGHGGCERVHARPGFGESCGRTHLAVSTSAPAGAVRRSGTRYRRIRSGVPAAVPLGRGLHRGRAGAADGIAGVRPGVDSH